MWKDDEEKLLLNLRLGLDIQFNSAKNHETLWNQIVQNGVKETKDQARNKFKLLKKKYREIMDENNKTGNYNHKWKYFETFQDAFGHKASTQPGATFDSSTSTSISNEKKPAPTQSKGKGKRKHNADRVIEKIDEINSKLFEEMKVEHEEKMQKMDWFLSIFEKSVGKKPEG